SAYPRTNFAPTFLDLSSVTTHGSVPVHSPDHPANSAPVTGAAVSVTEVPGENCAWQTLPHEMPAGSEVTTPGTVPVRSMTSVTFDSEQPQHNSATRGARDEMTRPDWSTVLRNSFGPPCDFL